MISYTYEATFCRTTPAVTITTASVKGYLYAPTPRLTFSGKVSAWKSRPSWNTSMGGAAVAQSNTEADILKVDTRFKYNFVVTNFCSATMFLSHFTASHMIFPLSYFRPVPLNRQTRQSSHYFT